MNEFQAKVRAIPAIDRLLAAVAEQSDMALLPRELVVRVLREATDDLRRELRQQPDIEISTAALLDRARALVAKVTEPSLRKVVNATGVVLHTNLGRAPLSLRAKERLRSVTEGYSTLEYDVTSGERGSRYAHVAARICGLTAAEAAIVVNNNAAAVLLVLSAMACGKEVIVSRGQLVEIGGSFRVPDVLRQSGCQLVEVGTTNKTHLADYERAISPNTAAILKVHTSNYRILGFAAQPEDAELVALAKSRGLAIIEDLGSGTLLPLRAGGWHEPSVGERLAAGMDVVTFSGDKLFGGPQAGIIAGRKECIDAMRKHPLLRAIRIDKLSLAALEGTLLDYEIGIPREDIPVQRMLNAEPEVLAAQANALAETLKALGPKWRITVTELASQAGGGSLPAVDLAGWGVSVGHATLSAAAIEKRLRNRSIPIIVRIQEDKILLDVRCLAAEDTGELVGALRQIGEGAQA